MDLHWRAALAAACLLLCTFRVAAGEPRTIEIRLDEVPKFDVLYHRVTTNAIGAMFGSFIGMGIQASVEGRKDETKRETLSPFVSASIWNDVFVKTLNDSLREKGFEPIWVAPTDHSISRRPDAWLAVSKASYGFRMVDVATALVSPYVEFQASYSLILAKQKVLPERFYVPGEKQESYDQLVAEGAALNEDVQAVLARAAHRLANKIIYNIK